VVERDLSVKVSPIQAVIQSISPRGWPSNVTRVSNCRGLLNISTLL